MSGKNPPPKWVKTFQDSVMKGLDQYNRDFEKNFKDNFGDADFSNPNIEDQLKKDINAVLKKGYGEINKGVDRSFKK